MMRFDDVFSKRSLVIPLSAMIAQSMNSAATRNVALRVHIGAGDNWDEAH